MVPHLFEENFFGEGYNGFDAMIQNLKSGHRVTCDFAEALRECHLAEDVFAKSLAKISKQVSSNATFSSFKLYWSVISHLLDDISNLHCQFSQEKQSLAKSVQLYIEEQQKSRKLIKENESSTQDVTHSLKITSAQLQKSKELYHTRYAERQRMLRTDTATTRDQEKSEAKLKKAENEYKYLIKKYNNLLTLFITRMRSSARHFQELEQSHLERMNEFMLSFVNHWSNVAAAFNKLYTLAFYSLSEVTVERSLLLLVEKLGTGSQEPQCAFFEDAEVAAAFAFSVGNGEGIPDAAVKGAFDADSCSDDRSLEDCRSTPSGGVMSIGSLSAPGSDAKRSVGHKITDRFFTRMRRNSPAVEASQATAATANGTGPSFAVTRKKGDSPVVGDGTRQATGLCALGGPQQPQPGGSVSRISRLLNSRNSSSKSDVKASGANATSTGDWRVAVVNNVQTDGDGYSIPQSHFSSNSTVNADSSSSSDSEEDEDLVRRSFQGIKLNIRPVGEFAPGVVKPMEVPQKLVLQQPPITSRSKYRRRPIPWVNAGVSLKSAERVTHQEPSTVPLPPPSPKTTPPVHSQPPVPCSPDEQLIQETVTKSIQDDAESITPKPTYSPCAADVFSEGDSYRLPSGRRCSSAAQLGAAVEGDIHVGGLLESQSMDGIMELSDQPAITSKPIEKTSSDGNSLPVVQQQPPQQKPPSAVAQQQQPGQQQAISLPQPTLLHEPWPVAQQVQAPIVPITVAAAFTETWSVTFHNGGGSSFSTVALSTPPPWQRVTGELTLAFPLVAFDQLQRQLRLQFDQEPSQHPSPPFPLVLSISGAIRIRRPRLKVPNASLTGHCADGRSILLSDESEACLTPPPCTSYTITVPSPVLLQLLYEAVRSNSAPMTPNPYGLASPAARPSYLKVDLFAYTVAWSAGLEPLTPPIQLCTYWRCERESTDFRLDYATRWPNRWISRSPAAGYLIISMEVDGGVSRMQSLPEGVWSPLSNEATWRIQLSPPPTCNQPDSPKPGGGPIWKSNGDSSGTIRAKFQLARGPGRPQPVVLKSYQEETLASGLRLSLGAVTPANRVSGGYVLSLCKNRIICDLYVCEPPG